MYCFKIKPTKQYAGGCALVAAHNAEEAVVVYCRDEFNDWRYDDLQCTCNIVHGLHHDTETPKIILNEIYEA